jgi:hypothetical protein
MTPEEFEHTIGKQRARCICFTCHSYNRCAKDRGELLYCINGKSFICIAADMGCICRKCPVSPLLGLRFSNFCLKGAEAAQRYEQKTIKQ